MKIISDYKELEGKVFDSPEACLAEEKRIDEEKTKAAEATKPYEDAVTAAKETLVNARKALKDKEAEVDALVKDTNARIKEMLCPARKNVREAEMAVIKAIEEYNKNVGPYKMDIKAGDMPIDRIVHEMLASIFN